MPDAVPVSGPPTDADLEASATFDFDDPAVAAFARDAVAPATDDVGAATRLFTTVRESVRYNPYGFHNDRATFTASATLRSGENWCVPKAILLAAGARAVGIPARIGFADVRNHLSSERLTEMMGTDLFVYHGYTLLYVEGAWRKVSPAFNAALCERFGVPALDWDGRTDALMHAYAGDGQRHMEYVIDHGAYTDVPFAEMGAAFRANYDIDLIMTSVGADPVFG